MYQTFKDLYESCQALSSDDNATTLINFKKWLNQGAFKAYKVLNAEYFYKSATDATEDGTYSYPLPFDCSKVHTITITDDNDIQYPVGEFPGTENDWNALVSDGGAEAEYPQYFFIKKNTYEFYPTSSADDYTITVKYKRTIKDMSQADYTTGNITTLASAGTAVTGSGTTWTAAFVGRYFKIDADGVWYEITARSANTGITIAREYGGTAIAAGSEDYTIGEMSLLPEGYQELPIDYAMWMYYLQKENTDMADRYKQNWLEGLLELKQDGGNLTTSGILQETINLVDPNDNIVLSEAE